MIRGRSLLVASRNHDGEENATGELTDASHRLPIKTASEGAMRVSDTHEIT